GLRAGRYPHLKGSRTPLKIACVRPLRDRTQDDVEPRGLEPLTPCLQSRCATNCPTAPRRGRRQGSLSEACDHTSAGFWPLYLLYAKPAPAARAARIKSFFIPFPSIG